MSCVHDVKDLHDPKNLLSTTSLPGETYLLPIIAFVCQVGSG